MADKSTANSPPDAGGAPDIQAIIQLGVMGHTATPIALLRWFVADPFSQPTLQQAHQCSNATGAWMDWHDVPTVYGPEKQVMR